MISKIHIPDFPLNGFISHFFYYTGYHPEHEVERLLPDGDVQIIFELTERPKHIYDNETLKEKQTCKSVWFAGFRTEPITIPSGRESEMVVVQFKKGKALPFLNAPMHALTNTVVDAELVVKAEIMEIRYALQEADTPTAKLCVLEEKLRKFYQNRLRENPFIDFAVSNIAALPNTTTIAAVTRQTGYSHKHIIALFKKHIGVTPKEFLKVMRFQKAVEHIERQPAIDWASVALDCGYYDQSHFIADFKTFSGYTPKLYVQQKGPIINYIPQAVGR